MLRFSGPADDRQSDDLREHRADQIEQHDVGHAFLPKQLIAHGIADEHGVGHAAHDDEHAERAARQPQEPPEQEGEQVIEGNATERNEQVAPVFRQHFARQPRGQAVNAHTGNGDGHNESAEKGLGVRTDPTSDRADIASGSQQQDDRDRGD